MNFKFSFCVLVICICSFSQTYLENTCIGEAKISRGGINGIEKGDAISMGSGCGSGHGHMGLWMGVYEKIDGYVPDVNLNVTLDANNRPQVYFRTAALHQGGSSGSGTTTDGIGFLWNETTLSWSSSSNSDPLSLMTSAAAVGQATMDQHDGCNVIANGICSPVENVAGYNRALMTRAGAEFYARRNDITYCFNDMLRPNWNDWCWNDTYCWDNCISDVNEIRCDGIPTACQDYASSSFILCGNDNIMSGSSSTSMSQHNDFHAGNWSGKELCPIIVGHVNEAENHQGEGIPWNSLTSINRFYAGAPYLFGSGLIRTLNENHIQFAILPADYGSDCIYVTVTGNWRNQTIDLLVEGQGVQPFTDPTKMWYFKTIGTGSLRLTATSNQTICESDGCFYIGRSGPIGITHEISCFSFDWYGNVIENDGDQYSNVDVNSYVCFYITMMDAAGNCSVYKIDNPNYQ